jgi:hypothetical protein
MNPVNNTLIAAQSEIEKRGGLPGTDRQSLVGSRHPLRRQVEDFISRRFFEIHGARVDSYMPLLVALFDDAGEVLAAVGIRDASIEPLFLEYYLDLPIERAIAAQSALFRQPPARERIAEIGNLASRDRRASRKLFALLAAELEAAGFEWAVFTGCSSLHRMFGTLGIETVCLGRALQARLPADQQTWGSYYEDQPMVVAGKVSMGCDVFGATDGPATTGRLS